MLPSTASGMTMQAPSRRLEDRQGEGYSAATGSSAAESHADSAARARSVSAFFFAIAFIGPRRRLPSSVFGIRSSGGQRAEIKLLGWEERRPLGAPRAIAAVWPPD